MTRLGLMWKLGRRGTLCDPELVIRALLQMSDQERERCMKEVEVGLGRSCTVSEASEFGRGDKSEFKAHATAPTQEDAANTPCG